MMKNKLKKQEVSKAHNNSLVEQLRMQSSDLAYAREESSIWKLKALHLKDEETRLTLQREQAQLKATCEYQMLKSEAESLHAGFKSESLCHLEASTSEYQMMKGEAECLRAEFASESQLAVMAQQVELEAIRVRDAQYNETLQCEAHAIKHLKDDQHCQQMTIDLLVEQLHGVGKANQAKRHVERWCRGSQTIWTEDSERPFEAWQLPNRISATVPLHAAHSWRSYLEQLC